MKKYINIYSFPEELAEHFAEVLYNKISLLTQYKEKITIALSGGNTPKLIYKTFTDYYAQKIKWEFIHLFWGDERCVPPDHPDSNFKMVKDSILNFISIPESNIHRIKGENEPNSTSEQYSKEILSNVQLKNGLPSFDIFILGLGEDGHTASIFPDQMYLLNSDRICSTAVHPITKQMRITVTGKVINNSDDIRFLVTGKNKSEIIRKILNDETGVDLFPAYHVCSNYGSTNWYLDKDAAILLDQ